jgi:hypothetical protein
MPGVDEDHSPDDRLESLLMYKMNWLFREGCYDLTCRMSMRREGNLEK